jgi:hypothetical protein
MAAIVTAKSGLANRPVNAMGGSSNDTEDKIYYPIFKLNNDINYDNNT